MGIKWGRSDLWHNRVKVERQEVHKETGSQRGVRARESESDRSGRSNRWIVCPFNLCLHRLPIYFALSALHFSTSRAPPFCHKPSSDKEQRFSALNEVDVDSHKSGSLLMQRSFFYIYIYIYICIYFAVCELICTFADYRSPLLFCFWFPSRVFNILFLPSLPLLLLLLSQKLCITNCQLFFLPWSVWTFTLIKRLACVQ